MSRAIPDHNLKIVFLGNTKTGKSTFRLKLANENFNPNILPTIGVDLSFRIVQCNNESIKLNIWDTAGKKELSSPNQTPIYKGAHLVALFVDLTDTQKSIDYIQKRVNGNILETTHCVVVFTKSALAKELDIMPSSEYLITLLATKALNAAGIEGEASPSQYYVTSSKTDSDEALTHLLESWANRIILPSREALPISREIPDNGRTSKIVFTGDTKTGKSTFLSKLANGEYVPDLPSTIGADFLIKTVSATHEFQIWDTAGQERYSAISAIYYRGASLIALFVDLTSIKKSITCIEEQVKKYMPESTPCVVVFTKSDLAKERSIMPSPEDLKALATKTLNAAGIEREASPSQYCVTSSKMDSNEALTRLLESWANRIISLSATTNSFVLRKPLVTTTPKKTGSNLLPDSITKLFNNTPPRGAQSSPTGGSLKK